jgi:hypothetical protein
MNFVEKVVNSGGKIVPLVIDGTFNNMNPSIFVDDDGEIIVNMRVVNYIFYNAENTKRFPSYWGPLAYLHPENEVKLATENYLCRLDKDLKITDVAKVDMQELHAPIWEFTGLEDARVVKWDNKYFLTGVRRDTTVNGQGRMEYTEIDLNKKSWKATEIYRHRIPAPAPDNTYCEKNWIPILDKPFHFIKWSNPTEIVYADPYSDTQTISITNHDFKMADQRGSSHAVRWGDYYIAVTHEVNLWFNYLNQKDSIYRHRLLVWDLEFNLIGASEPFSFLDTLVEFCVGAAILDNDLLLSFSFQDNAAFILKVPAELVDKEIQQCILNR